ncbi:3-hydroxyacyl-CoA dehydrogenase NAD-binding domain-containing protein [Shinella sp. JR1-6]|jgi:carnitine 3-dehydrogenase|uniref:3-hydroxyacyl-CoA dehydrogenase NAD-binding domain-containing protein n=1 Tax=unclassified Shinella TaxID=2643062 RepID=UPI00102D567D|nr:3-hydroxyacyl-CoA dehydrogenase NAD-binding domain-containing protein [Shinella sp. JR1-6]TAA52816.1 hydrogenase [Shinella sp. JR1-6]
MANVWILGGGLIGCGWAVAFAGAGHKTVVIDPDPATEDRLAATWSTGRPVVERLGQLSPAAVPPRWSTTVATAGAKPELVQECLPERMALKIEALQALEPFLHPDTIIASSSSGLDPDQMAEGLARPERLLIAHPCNPPYLMPVVELCGGAETSAATIEWAQRFYEAMGKTVLKLSRPMPGHLVNRLQTALWREAVYLAREGVASVGDIERAVTAGLAPRWCFVGPTGVFHLAGAEGGIARCIDQLGPQIERWWESLGAPALDEKARRLLASGMEAHDPRPVEAIAADRDDKLASLMTFLAEETAGSKHIQTGGNNG